ncbi:MAG: DUF192 domain-containing protein [Candidatus Bipolaricaulia bacterium]
MARGKFNLGWPAAVALLVAAAAAWWLLPWLRGDYRTTPEFRGMEVREITLVNDLGERVELKVRVADGVEEQLAGFQHIGRRIIAHSLILFIFAQPIRGKFHMRNVDAPLDIAFIAADGQVLATMRMEPGPELYGPDEPFQYVLEAPAGLLAARRISPQGSRLLLESF